MKRQLWSVCIPVICFAQCISQGVEEHGYTQAGFGITRRDARLSVSFGFLVTHLTFALPPEWQTFCSYLKSLICIFLPPGKHCRWWSVGKGDAWPESHCAHTGPRAGTAEDTPPSYEKVWGRPVLFWNQNYFPLSCLMTLGYWWALTIS